jgi:dolichyl-diphosphooligosaccharide--protein glycosyltransferase
VFPVGDAYYLLRRAEYTLEHGSSVLLFDPLVNHPDGAWIPWPPLHTVLLAGVARAIGGTKHDLELTGAWLPPVIGALTAVPVFGAARVLVGPGTALLAALLLALLPMSISYSDVANADHHCTVSFLGALWLWGALLGARASPTRAGLTAAQALVVLGRLGVVFTWSGSLLYVLIADGAVLAVLALQGRTRSLRAHGWGLLATAAPIAIAVPSLGPPAGGTFSTIALSYLHAPAVAALAFVAFACAEMARRRPDRSLLARATQSAAIAAIAGGALLTLPGMLPTLRQSAGFVGKEDAWAALNAEQRPLFSANDRSGRLRPLWYYGGFGYLIPLVPLAALAAARDPRRRDSALVLAIWTAGFGALAMGQLRYGSDYAPAGAVGFALGIDTLRRALPGRRGRVAATLAGLVGAGPLVAQHVGQARQEIAALRMAPLGDPLLMTPTGSLYRFAEEVRRVTPETGGYFDPSERPEYAVLSPANVGHILHYVAHRATPSDNFGPYSASRHWEGARRFFTLRSEARALRNAEMLGARYVMTAEYGAVDYRSLTQRLHREDGLEREDSPRFAHFRLVAEGPRNGRPLSDLVGGAAAPGVAPYKLFEKVAGADLEVHAAPGSEVDATLVLYSPFGRHFEYVARAQAGDDGVAHLRVRKLYSLNPAARIAWSTSAKSG